MHHLSTREELAKLFLPDHQEQLEKLSLDELNQIEKTLLCCEVLEKRCYQGDRSEDERRYFKFYEFFSVYSRYHAAFQLCELLGVTDIYDIGCGFLNQAFLLLDKPNVSYTGIDVGFSLVDYRNVIDESHPNYHCPIIYGDLPDFCGGRIRFVNRVYPFEITPGPDNLAIAFHSFGYRLPDESAVTDEIRAILNRLECDFDRLLITIGFSVPLSVEGAYEYLPVWKRLMPGFEFYRIEHCQMLSLVFATKVPEDIEKIRSAGWFPTYRHKMHTIDGKDIKMDYDYSLDRFYEVFPYKKFQCTGGVL